jgi:hypothetical protein
VLGSLSAASPRRAAFERAGASHSPAAYRPASDSGAFVWSGSRPSSTLSPRPYDAEPTDASRTAAAAASALARSLNLEYDAGRGRERTPPGAGAGAERGPRDEAGFDPSPSHRGRSRSPTSEHVLHDVLREALAASPNAVGSFSIAGVPLHTRRR